MVMVTVWSSCSEVFPSGGSSSICKTTQECASDTERFWDSIGLLLNCSSPLFCDSGRPGRLELFYRQTLGVPTAGLCSVSLTLWLLINSKERRWLKVIKNAMGLSEDGVIKWSGFSGNESFLSSLSLSLASSVAVKHCPWAKLADLRFMLSPFLSIVGSTWPTFQ